MKENSPYTICELCKRLSASTSTQSDEGCSVQWPIQERPIILSEGSEGPDQTARMRSLIWASTTLILHHFTNITYASVNYVHAVSSIKKRLRVC